MKRSEIYPDIVETKVSEVTKVVTVYELAMALLKVQNQLHGVKRDASNPFFKSKYATLQSTWEACREALQDAGLAISQTIHRDNGVYLRTRLLHVSGQFIDSECPLLMKEESMQALGSAVSYARRYSLAAIVGLVIDEDDDGEAATRPSTPLSSTSMSISVSGPQKTFSTISEPQAKRFYALMLSRKQDQHAVTEYLKSWGYKTAKEIKPADYEAMCRGDSASIKEFENSADMGDIPF